MVPFAVPCAILKGSRTFASKRDQRWPCNDRYVFNTLDNYGIHISLSVTVGLTSMQRHGCYLSRWNCEGDYSGVFLGATVCIVFLLGFFVCRVLFWFKFILLVLCVHCLMSSGVLQHQETSTYPVDSAIHLSCNRGLVDKTGTLPCWGR